MLSADPAFQPDLGLSHGEQIGTLQALYTPGHAADHLCFARADGIVFTGDHVMGWNSSVVSPPPRGNMAAYIESLKLLLDHGGQLYLPGHGPSLPQPTEMVRDLIQHRLAREAAIIGALKMRPLKAEEIVQALYNKTDPVLKRAAERNVTAHLVKLVSEGRAVEEGDMWRAI
jgi:glyoxylase-like metal-dependent hydrolase (beta-lactamase superfamily II)